MTGTGSPLGAVVMPDVRLAADGVLLGFNVYAATAGDVEFMVGRVSFVFLSWSWEKKIVCWIMVM